MVIFLYIIIALASIYIGKIEKRVNVALIAAPISVPLGIMTAIGAFAILKLAFILLALFLIFLTKIKIIVKLKIAALLVAIASAISSVVTGPLGWVLTAVLVIFIISGIQETFISIYEWFFKKMAIILLKIRKWFDVLRANTWIAFHLIVCIFEGVLVCSLSLYSIWSLMDWVDGDLQLTSQLIMYRIIVLTPMWFLLYRNYIKDTTPPNMGGDGVESPVLVGFTDFVDFIF